MTSYRVIYDFASRDDTELTVKEGDIVESNEEPDKGWINAKKLSDGSFGFVPENYLEKIPSMPAMPTNTSNLPIYNNLEDSISKMSVEHVVPVGSSSGTSEMNQSCNDSEIQVGDDCGTFQNKNLYVQNNNHDLITRKTSSTYSTGTFRLTGDAYKPDPIKNIVGATMMGKFRSSGVENFMVGMATGRHTQSAMTYDKIAREI
jgi:hypothetical protein